MTVQISYRNALNHLSQLHNSAKTNSGSALSLPKELCIPHCTNNCRNAFHLLLMSAVPSDPYKIIQDIPLCYLHVSLTLYYFPHPHQHSLQDASISVSNYLKCSTSIYSTYLAPSKVVLNFQPCPVCSERCLGSKSPNCPQNTTGQVKNRPDKQESKCCGGISRRVLTKLSPGLVLYCMQGHRAAGASAEEGYR